jgi:cysteine-rich repeat protein
MATVATFVQLSPAACSDHDGPTTNGGASGTSGAGGTSGTSGTSSAGGTSATGGEAGDANRGGRGGSGTAGTGGTGGTNVDTGGSGGSDPGSGGEGNAAGEGGGSPGGAGGEGPVTSCGDGSVQVGEACDDGNGNANDGCHECAIAPGWVCSSVSPTKCKPRVVSIAAGWSHTCVALSTGGVVCWGDPDSGKTGYPGWGTIGDDEVPAAAGLVDVGAPVSELSAGEYSTCGLLQSGAIRCWGYGGYGQLGYGNEESIGYEKTPRMGGDVDVGGVVRQVVTGQHHTCVLLENGAVRCFGLADLVGYAGDENIGDDETPADVGDVNVGGRVLSLAAGSWHTCALLEDRSVRCWGANAYGELGYGHTEHIGDDEAPSEAGDVDLGDVTVLGLAAGGRHTCALLTGGRVRCWGDGLAGALGYGNTEDIGDDETPASVGDVPIGVPAVGIVAGDVHTCVLTTEGAVRCWGLAYFGQLGYGNTVAVGGADLPSSVGDVAVGGPVEFIAASGHHTCVVLAGSGGVRCWGRAEDGELGYGNRNDIGDNETPALAGDVDYY